jgi:hypothetical protein
MPILTDGHFLFLIEAISQSMRKQNYGTTPITHARSAFVCSVIPADFGLFDRSFMEGSETSSSYFSP